MNNLRTPAINAALERTLTRQRLTKYLAEKQNSLDDALSLYERNTRLSEALYTPLQALEVCLRNSLDREMRQAYGLDWLTNAAKAPLDGFSRRLIAETLAALAKSAAFPTHNDIVAELKFAFWVGLVAQRYDATLWRTALHKGFLANGKRPRSVVFGRLNAIRRFRNRVAHHEPIYDKADVLHSEIIEAIGWMCSDTQAWTVHHCRFPAVHAAP